ncbi:MAG: hypothetical protein GY799_28830 [Desulfobulbaceae bacterium]|nr:hypothetical protein [Desulfobulbaceae bacterium]
MRIENDVIYFDNLAMPDPGMAGVPDETKEIKAVAPEASFQAANTPGGFRDVGTLDGAVELGKDACSRMKALFNRSPVLLCEKAHTLI